MCINSHFFKQAYIKKNIINQQCLKKQRQKNFNKRVKKYIQINMTIILFSILKTIQPNYRFIVIRVNWSGRQETPALPLKSNRKRRVGATSRSTICPRCSRPKQMNLTELKQKCDEIHDNQYDLFFVHTFKTNREKLDIFCNNCLYFFKRSAYDFIIKKQGCSNCSDNMRISIKNLPLKGQKVHGNKYDYSLVTEIKNCKTKIPIKCNTCNDIFKQTIVDHLQGSGCSKCSGVKRMTLEEFKRKGTEIHKGKYGYQLVTEIKNVYTKVSIQCNCGLIFEQTPADHLNNKSGCIKCGGRLKLSVEELTLRGIQIHGQSNDYSLIKEIKNARTKVPIKCNKCMNIYYQTPSDHLNGGQSCPTCSLKKTEKFVFKYYQEIYSDVQTQKTFEDCINPKTKRKLPFDIYIPDYNLIIEVMGAQHFKQVQNWDLKGTQERDQIKEQYCIKNKINYIAIDQEDIHKNIYLKGKFDWRQKISKAIELIDQNTVICLKIGSSYNNI